MSANHSRAFWVKHWCFTASNELLHCWDILVIPFKHCLGKCTRLHELPPLRSQSWNCIFENKFFLWSRAIVFLQQLWQTEKDWTCNGARPFTHKKFLQEQRLNWQQPDTCHTNCVMLFWSGPNGIFPATSLPQNMPGIFELESLLLIPKIKSLFKVWKILSLQEHPK